MKKIKIMFLFMIFTCSLFIVSNINTNQNKNNNDLDIQMQQLTSMTESALPLLGNRLQNPKLSYYITSTKIPNWVINTTLNVGLGINTDVSLSTTINNGFRSTSQNGNLFSFVERNDRDTDYFRGKSVGNQTNNIAFYSLGQSTKLVKNKQYYLRAEVSTTGGPANISLIVYPGSNIYAGPNSLASRNQIINNPDKQLIELVFTASEENVTLSLRHFVNPSSNITLNVFGLGFYLKDDYELQTSLNDLYETLSLDNLKFDTIANINSKIESIRNKISTNRSLYSEDILAYVEDGLDKAIELRDFYLEKYQKVNALYSNPSDKIVLENLDQAMIDALKTEIEAMTGTGFKGDILERLNEVQTAYDLKLDKIDKNEKIDKDVQDAYDYIDSLDNLTEVEKQGYKDQIHSIQQQGKNNVNSSTTIDDSNTAYETFTDNLNNVKKQAELLHEITNRKNDLTETANTLKNLIDQLENLSEAEKAMYKQQIDQTLNQQLAIIDTASNMDDLSSKYEAATNKLKDVFLLAKQVDSIHYLEIQLAEKTATINGLTALTEAQKQVVIDELTTIFNDAKDAISLANTTQSVDQLRDSAETQMNAIELNGFKDDAKKALDDKVAELTTGNISTEMQTLIDEQKQLIDDGATTAKVTDLKEKALDAIILLNSKEKAIKELSDLKDTLSAAIDAKDYLTAEQKQTAKDELTTILNNLTTSINAKTTVEEVQIELAKAKAQMNSVNLSYKKIDAKKEIDDKVDTLKDVITNDANLTQTQKDAYLQELETKRTEIKSNIDGSLTLPSVDSAKNNGLDALNEIELDAYKQAAKNKIEASYQDTLTEIDNSQNLTEAQKDAAKDKLDELKQKGLDAIDDAQSKEVIDQIVDSVENDFENQKQQAELEAESNVDTLRQSLIDLLEREANSKRADINALNKLSSTEMSSYQSRVNNLETTKKAELLNASTLESLRTIYQEALNDLTTQRDEAFLRNNKNNAVELLTNKYNEISEMIELFEGLDASEKQTKKDELTLLFNNFKLSLEDARTTMALTTRLNNALAALNDKQVGYSKENTSSLLTKEHDSFIEAINAINDLSQTKKDAFLAEGLAAFNTAKDKLALDTRMDQMDITYQTLINELTNIYLEAKVEEIVDKRLEKERIKQDVETKYQEQLAILEALENLTEAEKQKVASEILAKKNETLDLIDTAKTVEAAQYQASSGKTYIEDKVLAAKKQDGKNFIEKHVNGLLDGGDLTEELFQKVVELNTSINNSASIAEVDEVLSEGLKDFDEMFEEILRVKRNEVKQALEAYAKDKDNVDEKAIIDEYVAMVTTLNFADQAAIDVLIANGKQALDDLYQSRVDAKKDEVKELLETYAGENRSDEVNQIITDAIAKIKEENYEDDAALRVIEDEAKALILAQKKIEAKEALDALKTEDATPVIEQMITEAKSKIDEQTSATDVDRIFEEEKIKILNQYIKNDVDNAKDDLDDYRKDEQSDMVKEILDKAKEDLDKAISKEEVDRIVEETKQAIDDQIKIDEKNNAKEILERFVGTNPSQAVRNILENGKRLIDITVGKENVDEVVVDYLQMLTKQILEEKAGVPRSETIQNLLDQAKDDADTKTTPEALKTIIDAFEVEVAKQRLLEAKQNAKDELDRKLGNNPTEEEKKSVEEAKKKIDEATSPEEVESILKDTENKIDDGRAPSNSSAINNIIIMIESTILLGLLIAIAIILKRKRV